MKSNRSKNIGSRRKRNPDKKGPIPASGFRRIAAIFYDSILLAGILFAATALLLAFNHGEAFSPGNPAYTSALVLITATFFTWFWTHGGQTLGMRAWKIRLEKANGSPCDTKTALTHWIVGVTLGLLLGLGWWFSLFDRKGRALQDIVCGTRVIRAD